MVVERETVKAIVVEQRRPVYGFCGFCGDPCVGPACPRHRDLVDAELEVLMHQPEVYPS